MPACVNLQVPTTRYLAEPRKRLKVLQYKVLAFLTERMTPLKPAVHGFVPNRSIVSNAKAHASRKNHFILNLDLEDFFPSITFFRVRGVLTSPPFNFSHQVATVIAHMCTSGGKLPQGAPTSPFLSNLVCRTMDRDMTDLARRNRATYTRYADDITFSFIVRTRRSLPQPICTADDEGHLALGAELQELITTKHHFAINEAKTRLSDRHRRMEVTGLTINKFPNVRRKFIDRIRGALNAWERNGYAATQKGWQDRIAASASLSYEQKPWKRQYRSGGVAELKNVLWGKLLYLRMVRGKDDLIYTRLAERYNALVQKEQAAGLFTASVLSVEPVVRDHATALEACFVIEWLGEYHSTPGVLDDVLMGQGTAFVHRELNLLVTCDHVFEGVADVNGHPFKTDYQAADVINKTLNLVRPDTQQKWPAKILYRNAQMDFAILAFEDPVPPHRYFSPMDNPIEWRSDGVLIGFPDWKPWNLPDFNDQKVLNRTEPNKGMISFTITGAGSIRPGNSGGPFTDDRLRVAGMAQRGAHMGSGHDECLCLDIINDLIAKYTATLAPPAPPPPPTAPAVGAAAPAPVSAPPVPIVIPPVPAVPAAGRSPPSAPPLASAVEPPAADA
jgi:RNA-directed DNA polymerase